jgi:hypothetical protein
MWQTVILRPRSTACDCQAQQILLDGQDVRHSSVIVKLMRRIQAVGGVGMLQKAAGGIYYLYG